MTRKEQLKYCFVASLEVEILKQKFQKFRASTENCLKEVGEAEGLNTLRGFWGIGSDMVGQQKDRSFYSDMFN